MLNKIKRYWKVLSKQEPPYNVWIDHWEWHNRDWREIPGLRIVAYDRENSRIKVEPFNQ